MNNWEWLRSAGIRYLKMMDAEHVIFLSQVELSFDEQTLLIKNLSTARPLPWEAWANACVAIAAVRVAHDATEDETSLPRLFLTKLMLPYDQNLWEAEFGKRIEYIMKRFFPDDYLGEGAGRYVRPVYRHVGIPNLAVQRFGGLVRKLLDQYGPSFTRLEYDSLRNRIGGIASSFLESQPGFLYTRNSARILQDIDLKRIPESETNNIPGFRRGFWTEILAGNGRRVQDPTSRAQPVRYADPFLALSIEEQELEIRFDWGGVQRGLYSVSGSSLTKASVRCSAEDQPWIEIEDKRFFLDRWWSPGLTKAALFRVSDGGFVTAKGGVPPGCYYLAAEEEDALSAEWIEEEAGYLGATNWRIWRVALPAHCEIPALGIHTTGQVPAPVLEFAGKKRSPLGPNIFEGEPPQVLIRNWDETNAARFSIVLENGSGSRPLDVPIGAGQIQIPVVCPAMGLLKIQPRGLVRQESALSVLQFAVVPPGFEVCFSKQIYANGEPALVECSVPDGWKVISRGEERHGSWVIPAQEATLDAAVTDGSLKVEFSLRIPRISVSVLGRGEHICWEPCDIHQAYIQGPSRSRFELVLAADNALVALTGVETIPKSGIIRLEGNHFKDALRSCQLAAGEFAVRLLDGTLVRSRYHYASSDRIREAMGATTFPEAISKLPTVGPLLGSMRRMCSEPLTNFDWSVAEQFHPLKIWIATMAHCAQVIDRTTVEGDPVSYADPGIVDLCSWYARASLHCQTGESSRRVLDGLPLGWDQLAVERWRQAFCKLLDRLKLQSDVPQLVEDWRCATQRRDGSAQETVLGKRSGGGELCEGANKYLIACQSESDRARNKSFNTAITELERCRSITDCLLVRAIAATLLRLAYQKTDRTDRISPELKAEGQWAELNQIELSPWQGDYGSTKCVAAG